jgi:hypothetical protein
MALEGPLVEGVAEGVTTVFDNRVVEALPLKTEIETLLADTWATGSLLRDYHEAQGATELEVGPWLPSSYDGGSLDTASVARKRGTRKVTMRIPAPAITMRQTVDMSTTYRISSEEEGASTSLCIEIASVVSEVPYGGYFVNCAKISFVSVGPDVAVTKVSWVVFNKSTMLKTKIASTAAAEQRRAGELFFTVLTRHATVQVPPQVNPIAVRLPREQKEHQTRMGPIGCCFNRRGYDDAGFCFGRHKRGDGASAVRAPTDTDTETFSAPELLRTTSRMFEARSVIDQSSWYFFKSLATGGMQYFKQLQAKQSQQQHLCMRLGVERGSLPAQPCPRPHSFANMQEERPFEELQTTSLGATSSIPVFLLLKKATEMQKHAVAIGVVLSTALFLASIGAQAVGSCGGPVVAVNSWLSSVSEWLVSMQASDVIYFFSGALLMAYPFLLFCWTAVGHPLEGQAAMEDSELKPWKNSSTNAKLVVA